MKTICLLTLILAFPDPSALAGKTADNLLKAYQGELTASSKYAAFSEQARKEGYERIAILFMAASRSEAIHAANHKTVLEKMGVTVRPFTPSVTSGNTKENLETAIAGETNEAQDMYPGYIATAKQENATNAVKSMRWAMETERRHILFYRNALTAMNNKTVASLPSFYWICPKCGNTYDTPVPEDICSFCGTASNRYIKVTR